MTHISRRLAAVAALSAALLPLSVLPALASTEVVAAPLAAPTGLTPDDSAAPYPHTVLKTVKLDWAAVSGATGYRVEVGRDSTWSDDPVWTADVFSSEATLPVWLPHASYVWRVAALKAGALGHWSSEEGQAHSEAEFTRGWRVAPTPVAPLGDLGTAPMPEFSWTPVASASAYQVEVSDAVSVDPATASPDTSPSPTTQYTAGGAVDSCYTTRTRVTFFTEHVSHGESNPGACESTLLGTGAPRFWRVRALDNYVDPAVDVSTSPAAGGISESAPSGTPDATIGSDCPEECAPSNPGEFSNWSDWQAFSVTFPAPGAVDLTQKVATDSLAGDADHVCSVTTGTTAEHATCTDFPTITWPQVPGAAAYRVTIGLDDEMSNVQRVIDTPGTSWTPTDAWADSTPGTSYYYTVQVCSASACGGVTSTPPSFRKVTPRLTKGSVPGAHGDLTLSWQSYAAALKAASGQAESQDAFAYRVQVATSAHPSYDATVLDTKVDQTYVTPTVDLGDGDFVWRVQPIDSAGHKLPWSTSQAYTRDNTPPKVVSVSPSSRVGTKQNLKVVFSETVTGLATGQLTAVTGATTTPTTVTVLGDGKSATLVPTAPFVPGATYTVNVGPSVKDLSGNTAAAVGPTFTVSPIVDDTNAAIGYTSGWVKLASSNAYGGSFHQSSTAGKYLVSQFSGPAISFVGCVGPSSGYVDISAGAVKKRISLYRTYSGCGVKLASLTGLGSGVHVAKATVVGGHPSGSKGNAVGIDFLAVGA